MEAGVIELLPDMDDETRVGEGDTVGSETELNKVRRDSPETGEAAHGALPGRSGLLNDDSTYSFSPVWLKGALYELDKR